MTREIILSIVTSTMLFADTLESDMAGFDDDTTQSIEQKIVKSIAVDKNAIASSKSDSSSDTVMDGFDDDTSETVVTPKPSADTTTTLEDATDDLTQTAEKNSSSSDAVMDGFAEDTAVSQKPTPSVEDTTTTTMEGFDDENQSEVLESKSPWAVEGLTGKLTEEVAYSYLGKAPYDDITSLKTSLFLDYEYKSEEGWKFKTNARWYYDAVYDLRDAAYSDDELGQRRHEIELFDAYLMGSLTDKLDFKVGRQVVVWGRSDTIRITDVLNPVDNRRIGMVDIEDLRLSVGMAKLDYFVGDWRVSPIVIAEQRFSKLPAFGSAFNPQPDPHLVYEKPHDLTYALSIGGEFPGWDVNFYGAHIYNDSGRIKFLPQPTMTHEKIDMLGTAFNVLSGSWLFKTELAYFDKLKYTSTQEKSFSRIDGLLGVEYNGIADTSMSYDLSLKHLSDYDARLMHEAMPIAEDTFQQAFRVSSKFMNDTLTANYLLFLQGKAMDEGGFQRAWIKYELGDGINATLGLVDYIGGSKFFDTIKDNDMIFTNISYNF